MAKPLIFISHITEEKELAQSLKILITSTFLKMVEVFVASDPSSIKGGKKWLEEITLALNACAIEVIIASPNSVKRPWINFEAGAGWIRNIPVIPLCHSGMNRNDLPAPLNALQSGNADKAGLDLIFAAIAEAVDGSMPDVDYSGFVSVVNEFETTSRQIDQAERASTVAPTAGLLPHELMAIVAIAELADSPDEKVSLRRVKENLQSEGLRGIAVTLAIKMLSRKGLAETGVDYDYNHNEIPVVQVTDEGYHWLNENKDKFTLTWLDDTPPMKEAPSTSTEFPQDDVPF